MPATRNARLDPRAPLVLDTRELGRRPGSMRRVQRTVPAPADWALELVRVPAGSAVELHLRLESVMDGVLVSGVVSAEVAAECGRCLEPVEDRLQVDVQELFTYAVGTDEDGEEIPHLDGDFIDIEPLVHDAVVLGFPLNPVCAEDCAGLCAGCGVAVRSLPADHSHETVDPRWAALASARPTEDPAAGSPAAPEIGS